LPITLSPRRAAAPPAAATRLLATSLHATFLPDDAGGRLFLWTDPPRRRAAADVAAALTLAGASISAAALTPARHVLLLPVRRGRRWSLGERPVAGHELELLAASALAGLGTVAVAGMSARAAAPTPSLQAWSLAAKLALELVAREQVVPVLRLAGAGAVRSGRAASGRQLPATESQPRRIDEGERRAGWAVALSQAEDRGRLEQLAAALPPAAYARPAPGPPGSVWQPASLIRAFLDGYADAAMREAAATLPRWQAEQHRWEQRLADALTGPAADATFETSDFRERHVARELAERTRPILAAGAEAGGARGCFRLGMPVDGGDAWSLELLLQAVDEPGLVVSAADVWRAGGRSARMLGRVVREPQEQLLRTLGEAARVFEPLEVALRTSHPTGVTLDAAQAWRFLAEAAPVLDAAGFGVLLPEALTAAGERRLKARMRVGTTDRSRKGGTEGIGLAALVGFRWEAAVGDQTLTEAELRRIAKLKQPLVKWRGQWLVVDPRELERLERRFARATGAGSLTPAEALAAALTGTIPVDDGGEAEVVAAGDVARALGALRGAAAAPVPVAAPAGFIGELRPYQARGVGWLAALGQLGLGGVLADDMGLGKTIQLIALLLHERPAAGAARRVGAAPALIVCPTSVLGNWEHELERFAPSLVVRRHHGTGRERRPRAFAKHAAQCDVLLTTYGTARRDAELLGGVQWSRVVLDEAQNIKNPASQQAKVARALPALQKVALSGTPVENRLEELWSILDFTNAGLLGPRDAFQKRVAAPIERYGDTEAAARLRRLTAPFVLRRTKTDPVIAADLPAKQELRVWCTLTGEQAALYQATVDDALAAIEAADGMQRRGRVLALLTALKQICNHPAHYLGEPGPLPGRSGKLTRLGDMLEEVAAAGERALVFTQYREMGDRLVAHLQHVLGDEVLFLHGGVPRTRRDALVKRFQNDADAPPTFVLSLRAGGVGLNLTRANHVFHFDRWWNPAVEDQATDRVFRIGQRRDVQVHKFVTLGTLEERIDGLLQRKRSLAEAVVGSGEGWITELSDAELRALVALGRGAAIEEEG
jgi:SNF2 family DNA or RNA helicase